MGPKGPGQRGHVSGGGGQRGHVSGGGGQMGHRRWSQRG